MTKNILVRVDFLPENGFGHIIRQLNLLKKLNKSYFIYILSKKTNIDISSILNSNFKLITFRNNKDLSIDDDIKKTQASLVKYKCKCLIVDNYNFSKQWYQILNTKFSNTIVFHDYISTFKCKYLFGNNNKYKNFYKINELGFINDKIVKFIPKNIKKNFKIFLIDFGTIDKNNFTELVLDKLVSNTIYEKINVFLGPYNKNRSKIIKKFSKFNKIYFYDLNLNRKPDFKSGIFIGSGGITTLENFLLGKIIFIIKSSNNQIHRINFLNSKKNVFNISLTSNNKLFLNKYFNEKYINNAIKNYNLKAFKAEKFNEIEEHKKYITLFKNLIDSFYEN